MESLEEILRRRRALADTLKASMGIWSSIEEKSSCCPRCKGAGFVYADVPLGHPDFGKAVPCYCTKSELEENCLTRLQRYSNLGPLVRLNFDSLIPSGRTSSPQNQQRFNQAYQAAIAFAQNPRGWLIFTGPSGCGKTHLAAAIGNYRLKAGHLVFFMIVPDLLDHLRSTFSPDSDISYDELFFQVRDTPLLILDDLGSQSSTRWAQEKLFQIINHRFNAQLPTVITTNLTLDQLDERLRTRLADPSLSQIYQLETEEAFPLDYLGNLGLELLQNMTFDSFEFRADLPSGQRDNLVRAFHCAKDFAASPQGWLIFQGTNGCGKTHLAAAIANYQLQQGKSASFVIVPDLLDHLRATFSPESKVTCDKLFEQVKEAPLLILDDFGEHWTTPWAQVKLYQLINYRYNARLPTVITTCLSLDEIETRISSRVADPRLSLVFYIEAPDYRSDRHTAAKVKSPRQRL